VAETIRKLFIFIY